MLKQTTAAATPSSDTLSEKVKYLYDKIESLQIKLYHCCQWLVNYIKQQGVSCQSACADWSSHLAANCRAVIGLGLNHHMRCKLGYGGVKFYKFGTKLSHSVQVKVPGVLLPLAEIS